MTDRERMECRAVEVARAIGIIHKYQGQPTSRTFYSGWDGHTHYEWGAFTFDGGLIRVQSQTLDVEVERAIEREPAQ